MNGFGNETKVGSSATPEIKEEEPEPSIDREVEEDEGQNGNIEEESPEDLDSPRTSQPPSKRIKLLKKKRKRSSSEGSSFAEVPNDAGQKVSGPLSSTNKEINIGNEYQAFVDEETTIKAYSEDMEDPDEEIWETPENINEEKLKEFVGEATVRHLAPIDRALFLLAKNEFNFDVAAKQIAQRNHLDDVWLPCEVITFDNSFQTFGKNFSQYKAMLSHRSIKSIIQYYYDQKKRIKIRQIIEHKLNESSSSEDHDERSPYHESIFEGMCENCGERAERMEINEAMNRSECRACLLYFRQSKVPRPTSLRLVLAERLENHLACPEYIRHYMREYKRLIRLADGSTFNNRKIGKGQVLKDITEAHPSTKEEDKPLETVSNTEEKPEFSNGVVETPKNGAVKVWKRVETVCNEEMKILPDDARRKFFDASRAQSRVNVAEVNSWKTDMDFLKQRMERMNNDMDLIPSILYSEDRVRYAQEWTEVEHNQALRCFQWYGNNFDDIADVIGTKTPDQIYDFYVENQGIIDELQESKNKVNGDTVKLVNGHSKELMEQKAENGV